MATRRCFIYDLHPADGGAYVKPSIIDDGNDLFPHERVALKNAVDGTIVARFNVPDDYVGGAKFYLRWVSTATAAECRLTASYRTVAVGASMDPTTVEEALAAVDATVDSTALDLNETDLGAATAANFTAGEEVLAKVVRSGAHANDDMAGECLVECLIFEYTT